MHLYRCVVVLGVFFLFIVTACSHTSGKNRIHATEIEDLADDNSITIIGQPASKGNVSLAKNDSTDSVRKIYRPAPLSNTSEQYLERTSYFVSYNKDTKCPNWVAWHLTAEHADGDIKRFASYLEDEEVPKPRATNEDYKGSGWSHGHMCPAGDNKWDAEAMKESNLLTNMVTNPVLSVTQANYIGILFWAILIGVALKLKASQRTIEVVHDFSEVITLTVKWIIQFAPFGILGLVFSSVSESGLEVFTTYGQLVLLLVGCMLFGTLVFNPLIAFLMTHKNPYPLLFTCLRESGINAFFTRSSAANIPINMRLCQKLGLDEKFYSVCIPLGATINMDGAAVTITVMTLAVAPLGSYSCTSARSFSPSRFTSRPIGSPSLLK